MIKTFWFQVGCDQQSQSCSNVNLRADIWFHRYNQDGKDIEGRCTTSKLSDQAKNGLLTRHSDDYNSWQESWWGRWKRRHLHKDVILAEGIPP